MAHFYGSVQGSGKEVSRLGTAKSGMSATVAGWAGAVKVRVWHNSVTGLDQYVVQITPWENSGGSSVTLSEGVLDCPRQVREEVR